MRIFPLDILAGLVLLLSLAVVIIGTMIFRYRRGVGPALLVSGGLFLILYSIYWLLSSVHLDTPQEYGFISGGIGLILLLISFLTWRRGS